MDSKKIILVTIILIAIILRFYKLDSIPFGFHADEAAMGYNAYSIIKTGKDEYGTGHPILFLRSFDDWKAGGYVYLTIPGVIFFGLNEFSSRLPTAFFGALTVPLLFFIAKKFTASNNIALLSTFLLAVSPWHINLSRIMSEPVVAVFFVLLGLYVFLIANERKSLKWLFTAFMLWLASFYIYHSSRIFVPLLVIVLLFLYKSTLDPLIKRTANFLAIFLILIPLFFTTFFAPGVNRFKAVSIFDHPYVRLILEEQIREDGSQNTLLTRAFHNKVLNYSREALKNYTQHFTFDFFFLNGGLPFRENIPNQGIMHLIEAPFLLAGLYFLIKRRSKNNSLILSWILLSPVSAAITFEDIPNVHRFIIAAPMLELIVAIGFSSFLSIIKQPSVRNTIIIMSTAGLLYGISYYLHQYYIHQQKHRPWYRFSGYREMVDYVSKNKENYDRVFVTKAHAPPHIFFLFYEKYDPVLYQKAGSPDDADFKGFDKYVFIGEDCPANLPKEAKKDIKTLFVERGECTLPDYVRELKVIRREDDTPAFRIVEVDPLKKAEISKYEQ